MSLQDIVYRQFKQPSGWLGWLAGRIMANRSSNIERNLWLLELLDLQEDNNVLEIGFGPGIAIEAALKKVTRGNVIGVDHSRTMFAQATRRNEKGIAEKRAQLYIGDVAMARAAKLHFDYIYSSNVVQFWNDPVTVFRSLKQLLKPGGIIATLYMPSHRGATNADAIAMGDNIVNWACEAGFEQIKTESKDFSGKTTMCVLCS
ncbi:MAG: class I SAM-dependent methyltransferase [Gammaproteobacteria bacterium]|nr:class I SAM-dependent methyltransferase [Gammaproteobacteria bacterium]